MHTIKSALCFNRQPIVCKAFHKTCVIASIFTESNVKIVVVSCS
jgi:hypothetical protein